MSIQKAVDLTPDRHADKPLFLFNFGLALSIRLDRLHDSKDLEAALGAYSYAANSPIGSPNVRFHAALAWAKCSDKHARSSLPAYSCAIELLPRVAWLGLPVTDQHALLADIGSIVRQAVSAAIQSDELQMVCEKSTAPLVRLL